MTNDSALRFAVNPPLDNAALNTLFAAAWEGHTWTDFGPTLAHALAWVAAWADTELVGFVKLAWDGGIHAFLLDPTVAPAFQRRGIGQEMVRRVVQCAAERGMEWVHVDFEPHLRAFYARCGFQPSPAGVLYVPGVKAD